MIEGGVEEWVREVVACGAIVQDEDEATSPEEADKRFNRYLELVDSVDGDEPFEVFDALFRSVRAPKDHGAYQSTWRAVMRFPPQRLCEWLVRVLPDHIARRPDHAMSAGDVLNQLALDSKGGAIPFIGLFNDALAMADPAAKRAIIAYVRSEERSGWLANHAGLFAAGVSPDDAPVRPLPPAGAPRAEIIAAARALLDRESGVPDLLLHEAIAALHDARAVDAAASVRRYFAHGSVVVRTRALEFELAFPDGESPARLAAALDVDDATPLFDTIFETTPLRRHLRNQTLMGIAMQKERTMRTMLIQLLVANVRRV